MAYDEAVAARIREILKSKKGIREQAMFGGMAFLYHGNMTVGVLDDILVVRIGKENNARALTRPHTRQMDFTGRPMKGFVYVDPPGYRTAKLLSAWIDESLAFVKTLPKKY